MTRCTSDLTQLPLQAKDTLSIFVQTLVGVTALSVMWDVIGYTLVFGPDHSGIIGDFTHAFLYNVYVTCSNAHCVPCSTWYSVSTTYTDCLRDMLRSAARTTTATSSRRRFQLRRSHCFKCCLRASARC